MMYYKITKIYNDKIALLEVDKPKNNKDNFNSILIDVSLLDDFTRHYSYKYGITNYNKLFGLDEENIQHISTDKIIRLYHTTINYSTEPRMKLFTPQVPISASQDEEKIERVCLSDSIENCLNSISYGLHRHLRYELSDSVIRVYSVDIPLDLGNIIFPANVHRKYNVFDALFTHEHFYTQSIFMSSKLYKVTDFKYDYFDCASDWDKDIFKDEVLPENLRTYDVFRELDKYNFSILLNYCNDKNYEVDRLTGIDDFYIDLYKEFSFDVKNEILKFIKISELSFHDYILENTLKLEEIKSKDDYNIQESVIKDCNRTITSSFKNAFMDVF